MQGESRRRSLRAGLKYTQKHMASLDGADLTHALLDEAI